EPVRFRRGGGQRRFPRLDHHGRLVGGERIANLGATAGLDDQPVRRIPQEEGGEGCDAQSPFGDDREGLMRVPATLTLTRKGGGTLSGEDGGSYRTGHGSTPASIDQDQRSAAIGGAAHVEGAADARQPLGAADQTQAPTISGRSGLARGETDTV